MNEHLKNILGTVTCVGTLTAGSMASVEASLRIISLIVSIAVGLVTLVRMFKRKK